MAPITSRPPPAPIAPTSTSPAAAPATAPAGPAVEKPAAGWAPGVKASAPVAAAAPTQSSAQVATAFYEAFQKKDVAAFEKLYAPAATFKDPIYDLKNRGETLKMWTSLFKACFAHFDHDQSSFCWVIFPSLMLISVIDSLCTGRPKTL